MLLTSRFLCNLIENMYNDCLLLKSADVTSSSPNEILGGILSENQRVGETPCHGG
jgi:hypothetical protein